MTDWARRGWRCLTAQRATEAMIRVERGRIRALRVPVRSGAGGEREAVRRMEVLPRGRGGGDGPARVPALMGAGPPRFARAGQAVGDVGEA